MRFVERVSPGALTPIISIMTRRTTGFQTDGAYVLRAISGTTRRYGSRNLARRGANVANINDMRPMLDGSHVSVVETDVSVEDISHRLNRLKEVRSRVLSAVHARSIKLNILALVPR
jgi:hypothetical protein